MVVRKSNHAEAQLIEVLVSTWKPTRSTEENRTPVRSVEAHHLYLESKYGGMDASEA